MLPLDDFRRCYNEWYSNRRAARGAEIPKILRRNHMGPPCPQQCNCHELSTRVPNPWPWDSPSGAWPTSAQQSHCTRTCVQAATATWRSLQQHLPDMSMMGCEASSSTVTRRSTFPLSFLRTFIIIKDYRIDLLVENNTTQTQGALSQSLLFKLLSSFLLLQILAYF